MGAITVSPMQGLYILAVLSVAGTLVASHLVLNYGEQEGDGARAVAGYGVSSIRGSYWELS